MGDRNYRLLGSDSEKDSEKDSGYSEADSDFVHTDVDNQRSSVSEPHGKSRRSFNNNNNNNNNNSENAVGHNMPPYEDLSPVYVINNLVMKPSGPDQLLRGCLSWGGGWQGLTNAEPSSQLLLFQQPAMPAPPSSASAPSSSFAPQGHDRKGGDHRKQRRSSKNSYLPILNSYPRIAPHPRKDSRDSKGATWVEKAKESGSEGQGHSKRVFPEGEKMEVLSAPGHLPKRQRQQQHKEGRFRTKSQSTDRGGRGSYPCHTSSTTQHKSDRRRRSFNSDSACSSSLFSSRTPSPPSSSESPSSSSPPSSSPSSSSSNSPRRLPPDSSSTRHQRFLNTADILNQSGLLTIALRTDELLKQNAATEGEISQLCQHTHLLCQAAESSQKHSNEGSRSLDQLLQTMNQSGSYPNLGLNHLNALSGSNPQSGAGSEADKQNSKTLRFSETHSRPPHVESLHKITDRTSPPSPLFAPSPDPKYGEDDDNLLDLISSFLPLSDPNRDAIFSTIHNNHLL